MIFGNIESPAILLAKETQRPVPLAAGMRLNSGGTPLAPLNENQFRYFNLKSSGSGLALVDPHASAPELAPNEHLPDLRVKFSMLAFNSGGLALSKDSGATIRFDIGQDPKPADRLQPLFWSIAAGLDLYDEATGGTAQPTGYSADFDTAFVDRPVEVIGGVASLRFQMIEHHKLPWWRELMKFAQGRTGNRLLSMSGFPGVTASAIKIVDRAFESFGGEHSVLFESRKMAFAFSANGASSLGQMSGVEIGVINPGLGLLVQNKHLSTLRAAKPRLLTTYGRLVPGDWSWDEPAESTPLDAIPYVVVKVSAEAARFGGSL